MAFDYQHSQYRTARTQSFQRSDGLCQYCGQVPATEAHHWRMQYKPASETTPDELTALCSLCHELATSLRRFRGNRFEFIAKVLEILGDGYAGKPTNGIQVEQSQGLLPKRMNRVDVGELHLPNVEAAAAKLPKRQERS